MEEQVEDEQVEEEQVGEELVEEEQAEFLVRGKKKFVVNFGLKKIGATLYCFCVSLYF